MASFKKRIPTKSTVYDESFNREPGSAKPLKDLAKDIAMEAVSGAVGGGIISKLGFVKGIIPAIGADVGIDELFNGIDIPDKSKQEIKQRFGIKE